MSPSEAVARQVRRLRPTAKFIAVQHSREFIGEEADLGEGFFTANLYDERIDANMLVTKYGRVMIQNTYIASFAYNLFLCWLWRHRHTAPHETLDRLLAHNFKKFFAEQLYRQANRVPSRALLLETLLYEQAMMVEIFAAKANDPALSAEADTASHLMSFALSMHELGHYYLATQPGSWAEIVRFEPGVIEPLYERVAGSCAAELAVEFQCDVYAVVGCLSQYGGEARQAFVLRAIVFAFAAYAAMYSAEATAKATAASWETGPPDEVDLLSVAPMTHIDHEVRWAIEATFLKRAHLVAELCAGLAARRGVELYDDGDPFPLTPAIVRDLSSYVGRVFDCADENARRMSNLVAQALQNHDAGMEYLYLRSKTFQTNRPEPLDVR